MTVYAIHYKNIWQEYETEITRDESMLYVYLCAVLL